MDILKIYMEIIILIMTGIFSYISEMFSSKYFLVAVLILILLFEIILIQSKRIDKLQENLKMLEQEMKNIFENQHQYSTSHTYDSKGQQSYEFTWKVNEGHWATSIYDTRGSSGTLVKHTRTKEAAERDGNNRITIDIAENTSKVFGENGEDIEHGMKLKNGIYVPRTFT